MMSSGTGEPVGTSDSRLDNNKPDAKGLKTPEFKPSGPFLGYHFHMRYHWCPKRSREHRSNYFVATYSN